MNFAFLRHRPDFTIPPNGIDRLETLTIGGVPQTILIQSYSANNPVLLFLHGGPSMPLPGVSCRGADYNLVTSTKELVKHFTVVFWDQRGTGKSYSRAVAKESMRIDTFVQDAEELTDALRSRFGQDRIHLAAHSWGTVVGLRLVSAYPDKYHTYTAFSQIVNWAANDRLCYRWLMEQTETAGGRGMRKQLEAVGEPPYTKGFKQWGVLRKWLARRSSMFYDAGDGRSATMGRSFRIMLRSPDYSLKDIFHSLVSGFRLAYTDEMIEDLNGFDFFEEAPSLKVPATFVHGAKERHVWPELVEEYVERLDAPKGKRLVWASRSSHAFHLDDAIENEQLLISLAKADDTPFIR